VDLNRQLVVEGQHFGPLHQLLDDLISDMRETVGGGYLFSRTLLIVPYPQAAQID